MCFIVHNVIWKNIWKKIWGTQIYLDIYRWFLIWMGTLSAPFWCLCQKLSLSPLYFNKTLLHKSSERSSLVSCPGLNSSPPEAKNPGVFSISNSLSVSRYTIIWKTKNPLVFLNHYTQTWKSTVTSSPAFLFKQSSPKVSEAETVKGILRLFWASQENEVGTAQESKGSSQYLMCLGDGIKGEGLREEILSNFQWT